MAASQGCHHCRVRRIRCDKVLPGCTQCLRAGKKCPGYRDKATLMFRDESSKVMRRAHKQWGIAEPSGETGASSASPSSSYSPVSSGSATSHRSLAGRESTVSLTVQEPNWVVTTVPKLPMAVQSSGVEIGTRFYIENYIIGYPQEPKTAADFHTAPWFSSPVIRDIMAAVGLAAQANLTGNKAMKTAAIERYSVAVSNTRKLIANPAELDPPSAMRSVVLLAMYEVVSGTAETDQSIRQHILGAAVLLNQLLPRVTDPAKALRGVVHLCYSMVVPCYMAGVNIPGPALKFIEDSAQSLPPVEKAAIDLLGINAQFIQLSIQLKQVVGDDVAQQSGATISKALDLEAQLSRWEIAQQQPGSIWSFTTETDSFPPQAAYKRQYHLYAGGMWTAIIWNNYRWLRILIHEMLLDLAIRYPVTSHPRFPGCRTSQEIICRQAEELLVSVPTHYRHPALAPEQRALLDRTFAVELGQGGGSSGVPILMVQLRVAACAPGVPRRFAEWTLGLFETIWGATGMLQAKNLAGVLRAHMDKWAASVVKSETVSD